MVAFVTTHLGALPVNALMILLALYVMKILMIAVPTFAKTMPLVLMKLRISHVIVLQALLENYVKQILMIVSLTFA